MIETPILLMVFNRPDKISQLIDKLKPLKPKKLYIGADGPRSDKEQQKTEQVRGIIERGIDWDCQMLKLYRKVNLGFRSACSPSITWFFEHEEYGIILEDDISPSESFFDYCDEVLRRYEPKEQILHISGYQAFDYKQLPSYYFSAFPGVWRWATWRRAWANYSDNPDDYQQWMGSEEMKRDMPNAYIVDP